jgi:hypothetical protein
MRAGVSFRDWQVMARWQVQDFAIRHKMITEAAMKEVHEGGISNAIAAVVSRILGV